jgi:PQQ-dependent catabolism-associated CXXCW motif protein
LTRIAAAALATALATAVAAGPGVPEPDGLWTGPMRGETPATLAGATVLDVPALEALMAARPVLVDSGPADRRPANLPEGTLWAPVHRSIPGAAWFPGAGRADLPADRERALLARISALTRGDRGAPVVSFCEPSCWGSWNVGKRLVLAGYTAVFWLPAGVSGWQERNDTVVVEPEPGWGPADG